MSRRRARAVLDLHLRFDYGYGEAFLRARQRGDNSDRARTHNNDAAAFHVSEQSG
jgi:hypothetical protein